jgi:hypothetical protein
MSTAGAERGLLPWLGRQDRALYAAVAGTSAPALDRPLRELSRFANFSAVVPGRRGATRSVGPPAGGQR